MIVTRTRRLLHRLLAGTAGTVAVTTAICAIPMFGMMGLAIDYGILLSNKATLDAAADAAAVAAVTKAKAVLNAGGTVSAAVSAGQSQGIASFAANSGRLAFSTTSGGVVPQVRFQPSTGQTLNATVSYTMASKSQFGRLFGVTNHTVAGSSSSSTVVVPFYQFIFVVDISGSMSIGGTPTDINGLKSDAGIKCAFACHDPSNIRGPDTRAIAKADGWTLKIDYVNSAIKNFILDLQSQTSGVPGVFSVGIDTFATSFNILQPPTTSLSVASQAAAAIDVEPVVDLSISQGYTRTTASLAAALAAVNNIGDGRSIDSQVTYFIFLSDGVEDIEGNLMFGRGTDVSYTSACAQIKAAGATMISIAAPYPVMGNEPQYQSLVAPLAPPATPNYQSAMTSCATDLTWAYQATDGPGINAAVKAALSRILHGMTRLTN